MGYENFIIANPDTVILAWTATLIQAEFIDVDYMYYSTIERPVSDDDLALSFPVLIGARKE